MNKTKWQSPIEGLVVLVAGTMLAFAMFVGIWQLFAILKDDSAGMDTQTKAASSNYHSGAAILSVRELQEQLVRLGYDIEVDGKICDGWNVPGHSETITAWQKQEIEQIAQPIMKMYMERK